MSDRASNGSNGSASNGQGRTYPYPFSDGLWLVWPRENTLWLCRVVDPENELTEARIAGELQSGGSVLSLSPIYVVTSNVVPRVMGGQVVGGSPFNTCMRIDHRYLLPGKLPPSHHTILDAWFLSEMEGETIAALATYVHDAEQSAIASRSGLHIPRDLRG